MRSARLAVSIVAGLFAVLVGGAWVVGLGDPDGEAAAEMESLRSAPACDSQPTEPAGCIWEGEFEFVGSAYHRGSRGHNWYSIDLRDTRLDADGSPGFVNAVEEFDQEDIEGLTYGAPVTATLWRGRIIEVRIDGRDLRTTDYPVEVPERMTTAQLRAVGIFGGAVVIAGGLLPYRRYRRAQAAAQNGVAGD
ncbi:LigA [Nocardioidaceae bacterium Broad-1]|nr:LigA [Nocardioidaceae bacterium Broad-1]